MTNPTNEAVDEALRKVDSLITSIGDEMTGRIKEDTGDGIPLKGFQVRHGSHPYHVIASTKLNHIKIQAGFDAAEALATNQAIANAQGPNVMVSDGAIRSAQNEIQDRAVEDLSDIREGLVRRLSVDEKVAQLNADDEFVSGFQVEGRLFIYNEEVSISEFNDEIQSVINLMWKGKEFLVNRYDLRGAIDGGESDLPGYA